MKPSVLFVDDEPNILQGLQRMLREYRDEWSMHFAPSGPEALKILSESSSQDVVVSDMRMPGMDGAQLLTEVKRLYPQAVRIVLSGHSEREAILKSVQVAHQFLSKPCDASILKSTIGRTLALRRLLSEPTLMNIVSQVDSIPSLPLLYLQLTEELQSPNATAKSIGKIIAKDPGMTAKVLQMVNSSFFGIPRHIESPEQAVSLLGIDTIRALVLTIEVFSKFDQGKMPGLSLESLWEHCLEVGAIARALAKSQNLDSHARDYAFMAGLLHDIGKLLLAQYFKSDYSALTSAQSKSSVPVHKAEYDAFGTSHAEVGAYLLGLWGLPDTLVEAVAYHHDPAKCQGHQFEPVVAVHLADGLWCEQKAIGNISETDELIDIDFLVAIGLAQCLPAWREASLRVTERGHSNDK